MGERKLPETITIVELMRETGLRREYFSQNRELFAPALITIAGRPIRPYRFDLAVIRQIIRSGADQATQVRRSRKERKRKEKLLEVEKQLPKDDDELF